ncbi:MAG: hypothetical protein ABIL47_06990 [candidate division WOR-3 bacterium]
MATNPYFKKDFPNEQKLLQGFVNESIQIYGVDVYYIPKNYIAKDDILGEYWYSKLEKYFIIEMYIETGNYQTHGFDTSPYGLINNELKLIVSKDTWNNFYNLLKNNNYQEWEELKSHPREDDLIYIPYLKSIFEIVLVDYEAAPYNLMKQYSYEITCQLYRYTAEKSTLNIKDYKEMALESDFVRIVKLTDYGSGDFLPEETVVLLESNQKAKVVHYDPDKLEIWLREIEGDFNKGIIKGLTSSAVREIYSNDTKKRRPKQARGKNEKLETLNNEFFVDIENPFLK